jgi:hypothetical protein
MSGYRWGFRNFAKGIDESHPCDDRLEGECNVEHLFRMHGSDGSRGFVSTARDTYYWCNRAKRGEGYVWTRG